MLLFYRKDNNDAEATNKICPVHDAGAVSEKTVWKWFTRLKTSNISNWAGDKPNLEMHYS